METLHSPLNYDQTVLFSHDNLFLLLTLIKGYWNILLHCYRKSRRTVAQMQMGQSVTHAVIQPTHSPSWEELLLIEVNDDEANNEGLSYKNFKQAVSKLAYIYMNIYFFSCTAVILLVADHPSKELLTEFTMPLSHFKPFHQYHLELVQVLYTGVCVKRAYYLFTDFWKSEACS